MLQVFITVGVVWDKDSVEGAGETVECSGTLWILYLAEDTEVGIWKTSDFHTEASSVKSYAKSQSLSEPSDPVIKEGYQNISGKKVVDADWNKDYINNRDRKKRSIQILSLTTLGKNLMKTVDSDPRIRATLKEQIGISVGPTQPWWPGSGNPNESSPVYLRTFADKSVLEEERCQIKVIGTFDCFCCGHEIEEQYEVELEEGNFSAAWNKNIEVQCPECEERYTYVGVDPYRKPRSIDN